MPTLCFYYIISNNINIYIALSLESSRCGALWNHRDVVLFWNRLYRALSLELSQCDALGIVMMWCSFGIIFIEHTLWNCHNVMHLESSRCVSLGNRRDVALFLESSL